MVVYIPIVTSIPTISLLKDSKMTAIWIFVVVVLCHTAGLGSTHITFMQGVVALAD